MSKKVLYLFVAVAAIDIVLWISAWFSVEITTTNALISAATALLVGAVAFIAAAVAADVAYSRAAKATETAYERASMTLKSQLLVEHRHEVYSKLLMLVEQVVDIVHIKQEDKPDEVDSYIEQGMDKFDAAISSAKLLAPQEVETSIMELKSAVCEEPGTRSEVRIQRAIDAFTSATRRDLGRFI